jgi:hypothetical protein
MTISHVTKNAWLGVSFPTIMVLAITVKLEFCLRQILGACYSCRNLDWDGICKLIKIFQNYIFKRLGVSKCPSHLYEQLGRRCLTKTECEELLPVSNLSDKSEWKAFQTNGHKQCHYECPAGFEEG